MATKKKLNGSHKAATPKAEIHLGSVLTKGQSKRENKPAAPRAVRATTYVATASTEGKKLAPQARLIVDLIHKYGDKGVSKADLVGELKDKLKTKQPVERVLAYYTVLLKKDGVIGTHKS